MKMNMDCSAHAQSGTIIDIHSVQSVRNAWVVRRCGEVGVGFKAEISV